MTGGSISDGGELRVDAAVNSFAASTSASLATDRLYFTQGTTTITVANGAAANDLVISSQILETLLTQVFHKTGSGQLVLSGTQSNDYTGRTSVTQGMLVLAKTAGHAIRTELWVGDGVGADVVRTDSPNQFFLNAENPLVGANVKVRTSALFDLNGFDQSIRNLTMDGGLVTTGAGVLNVYGSIDSGRDSPGSTIAGRLSLGGGARSVNVADGTSAVDLTISADISNGSLTKTGAGTLALTGAIRYTGDTTVTAGQLRVGGTSRFENDSDVYLTSGATLNLQFTGQPNDIDSLFFDGASQLAGIWGAEGSGAQYTSPFITGTGLLQVMTYVAPIAGDFDANGIVDSADLDEWQTGFGIETSATPGDGDADADGDVDGEDFLTWQQQLGLNRQIGAVPEPQSITHVLSILFVAKSKHRKALKTKGV